MMVCKEKTTLTWVRGNDVNLTLWLYENVISDNNKQKREPFDFLACESIEVALVSAYRKTTIQHEAGEDANALVLRIPHTLSAGRYGIEVKAVMAGAHIRSFECGVVTVVNDNARAQPLHTRVGGLRATAYDVEILLTPAPPLRALNPWELYRKENPDATFDDFLKQYIDTLTAGQQNSLSDTYDLSLGVLKRESFYDDGSHLLVPLVHPRYASQPAILPQKFGNRYVYQQVFFRGQGEVRMDSGGSIEIFTLTGGNTQGKLLLGIKGWVKALSIDTRIGEEDVMIPLPDYNACQIALRGNNLFARTQSEHNDDYMIIVEYCDDTNAAPYNSYPYDSYAPSDHSPAPEFDSYGTFQSMPGDYFLPASEYAFDNSLDNSIPENKLIGSSLSHTYFGGGLNEEILSHKEDISFRVVYDGRGLIYTFNGSSWSNSAIHLGISVIDGGIYCSARYNSMYPHIETITLYLGDKPLETFHNLDYTHQS